jgi:ATP-dependent Clp protease, protease subunit
VRQRMAEIIAEHSGRPLEAVMKDIDRDHFLSPEDAVEYGIVEEIVSPRDLDGARKD